MNEAVKGQIRDEYNALTLAMRQLEKTRNQLLLRTVPASEGDRIEYMATVGSKAFSRRREKRVGIVQTVHLHHSPVSMLPHDEGDDRPFWSLRVLRVLEPQNELSRLADSVMECDFITVVQPSAPEF